MSQERDQVRGIARAFDQDRIGTDRADQSIEVPGAGRAVMADRHVDDPAVRIELRNQGRLLRASSISVQSPPSFWLRCLTTTSK